MCLAPRRLPRALPSSTARERAGEVVRSARAAGPASSCSRVVDQAAARGALTVEGAELRELSLPYAVPRN
jgi:hypothetical protein